MSSALRTKLSATHNADPRAKSQVGASFAVKPRPKVELRALILYARRAHPSTTVAMICLPSVRSIPELDPSVIEHERPPARALLISSA